MNKPGKFFSPKKFILQGMLYVVLPPVVLQGGLTLCFFFLPESLNEAVLAFLVRVDKLVGGNPMWLFLLASLAGLVLWVLMTIRAWLKYQRTLQGIGGGAAAESATGSAQGAQVNPIAESFMKNVLKTKTSRRFVVLAVAALLLAITNPSLESHKKFLFKGDTAASKSVLKAFGGEATAASGSPAEAMMNAMTKAFLDGLDYHNYVFFSTTTLDRDRRSFGILGIVIDSQRDF